MVPVSKKILCYLRTASGSAILCPNLKKISTIKTFGSRLSRMDQVKFAEDSLKN